MSTGLCTSVCGPGVRFQPRAPLAAREGLTIASSGSSSADFRPSLGQLEARAKLAGLRVKLITQITSHITRRPSAAPIRNLGLAQTQAAATSDIGACSYRAIRLC